MDTKITQNITGGVGNNNTIVQIGGNDGAAADGDGCDQLVMTVLLTIIGSYEPCDGADPAEVELLSTDGIRRMVLTTVGVELPLSVVYTALIEAGFVARLCEVPGMSKGVYFLARYL